MDSQLVDLVNWSKDYLKLSFKHFYLGIPFATQAHDQIECIISSLI